MGKNGSSFLPAEQGLYQERHVYKLDLLERSVEESVFRLQRYLAYADVCSGKSMDAAHTDYRNVWQANAPSRLRYPLRGRSCSKSRTISFSNSSSTRWRAYAATSLMKKPYLTF